MPNRRSEQIDDALLLGAELHPLQQGLGIVTQTDHLDRLVTDTAQCRVVLEQNAFRFHLIQYEEAS